MNIRTIHIVFLLIIGLSSCVAQEDSKVYNYSHPIAYNPETYVCHFTNEAIKIDGLEVEDVWQLAKWTNDFVDIEGQNKEAPALKTRVKMLYDKKYFYFYAEMEEPHIWAKLKNRDDIIYRDDDFEIFIDPDGDSHHYYEFEWNAFNTLWDMVLEKPYRVNQEPKLYFEYNVKSIQSAVHIDGTINDNSDLDNKWSIEIAIPWFALHKLASANVYPADGDQWRVNFSRVDWPVNTNDVNYEKKLNKNGKELPESNWVWSPTGRINMHMPEMWGYVQFSEKEAIEKIDFVHNRDEEIKWALWNLYWQQLEFYKDNNRYTDQLNTFTLPKLEGVAFEPKIYYTPNYFEIVSSSHISNGDWIINHEGRIYFKASSL